MPAFQEYLDSIKDPKQHQQVRIQLISDIEGLTGRKLIVYAADFRKGPGLNGIDIGDKAGFADLVEGIAGSPLDVFIHSPGGSAEATEQIVYMLRSDFGDIRFVVPHSAMSAATLMCLSGNTILMDQRSALGPTDPLIQIPTQSGPMWIPAQIILDGFERAHQAIREDPNALAAFLPLLSQYGPYVQVAEDALDLSKELASNWLVTYMFGSGRARRRANKIAEYLSAHGIHKSHSRSVSIGEAKAIGLNITDLREHLELRDLVWRLYCCVELYFDRTPACKLFESAHGVSWSRNVAQQQIAIQLPVPGPQPQGSLPSPPST